MLSLRRPCLPHLGHRPTCRMIDCCAGALRRQLAAPSSPKLCNRLPRQRVWAGRILPGHFHRLTCRGGTSTHFVTTDASDEELQAGHKFRLRRSTSVMTRASPQSSARSTWFSVRPGRMPPSPSNRYQKAGAHRRFHRAVRRPSRAPRPLCRGGERQHRQCARRLRSRHFRC